VRSGFLPSLDDLVELAEIRVLPPAFFARERRLLRFRGSGAIASDEASLSAREKRTPKSGAQPRQSHSEQRCGRLPVTFLRNASHVDRVREMWTLSDLQRGH